MTIVLHQAPWAFGGLSISPFCAKLECWLRMVGLPYETATTDIHRAPKGKAPWVEVDGRRIGDSQLIIEMLERTRGVSLDDGLDERSAALGHAVRRMLEEGTYFTELHRRYIDPDGFRVYRPHVAGAFPRPLAFLADVYRTILSRQARAQGTARHSAGEVESMACADLRAVAELLGDRPYVLGDRPRTVDATVFTFVDGLAVFPHDGGVARLLRDTPNLVAYRRRIRAAYFPELADGSTTTGRA